MRNYKRKTNRGQTPRDVMERAADAVAGGKSVRSAAKDFAIDRMTLKRYIERRDGQQGTAYAPVALRHQVFSPDMETDLGDHVKQLSDMFHGLSVNRCCTLAYEFAKRNNVDVPASWDREKKAGQDWWLGFKKRQNLAIRHPEATSLGRATAFNRPVVDKFFDNLARVMDKYKFSPSEIYNTDETGCTTVQKPAAVVTEKGKKQVGAITSAERGELVTVVYTVSAIGSVVPPLFIFPRVNYKHFVRGGPTQCIGRSTRSGWINQETFVEYLNHIIKHTRCTPERKILLILDNHDTHISLDAVDTARSHGVVMLTLPPHTSHRLQPLDRSVYGPLKTAYNRALDGWLRSNPGKTVTIYEIPTLVNQAQMLAVTPSNIIAGFQATGIHPFNRDIFNDLDFAPAVPTDREQDDAAADGIEVNPPPVDARPPGETPAAGSAPAAPTERERDHAAADGTEMNQPPVDARPPGGDVQPQRQQIDGLQPSTSREPSLSNVVPRPYVSPSDVHPFPKATARKKTRAGRKKGSTKILTDTPVRQELEALSENRKRKPSAKKPKRSLFKVKEKKKCPPRSKTPSSSETDCDSEVEYDDESDVDSDGDMDIIEGDFVVVKCAGKSRFVHYIARVDVLNGEEFQFEGVFLQKVAGKVGTDPVFVPNPDDEAGFELEDIVRKLPQPKSVGSSARCSGQLVFKTDLSRWQLS